eukprot:4038444-Amphidinium_carterae.1
MKLLLPGITLSCVGLVACDQKSLIWIDIILHLDLRSEFGEVEKLHRLDGRELVLRFINYHMR